MASNSKRSRPKTLTLTEKIEVIQRHEKGGIGARRLAKDFGVGKTQIQNILKKKDQYVDDYEKNAPGNKKRNAKQTGNEDINKLCWEFFCDSTSRVVACTGPLLQEKAREFAEQLGVTGFKASNGWLESFKKRHNIRASTMVGESGGVDKSTVEDWKKKIPDVTAGYAPENIFNMDESGLFYRTTTKRTLSVQGEQCTGGKQAKDRVTIMLCASMTGEKLKPLIIGKSARPRCFKHVNVRSLPVTYRNNKTAWMTSDLFLEWLQTLDRKMGQQNRRILLFADNAPSHPDIELVNVELKFFPPNTTSKLQPMDQGIIQTVKLKYRKRQLRRILQELESDRVSTGPQIAKRLTLLEAIQWVKQAWDETTPETIQKCFGKAGFLEQSADVRDESMEDEEVEIESQEGPEQQRMDNLAHELFGCDFSELAAIDEDVATCDTEGRDWGQDAAVLLKDVRDAEGDGEEDDDDAHDDNNSTTSSMDLNSLLEMVKQAQVFCAKEGFGEALTAFHAADDIVSAIWSKRHFVAKQTRIDDYFKAP
ncbi:tigger transposable element-derived protein 4-like [Branchiostoma lanceolatum]|uniref:tigger transposable element-derived protein 4-like n=1 Tax=Branchiostoma lanceolatum TaxID=7740 RepID=UPI00345506A0